MVSFVGGLRGLLLLGSSLVGALHQDGVALNSHDTADSLPLFTFNVLVTGFQPFLNVTSNPAELVAGMLSEAGAHCTTVSLRPPLSFQLCYEGMSLPVNTDGAQKVANLLEDEPYRYDAIIHLGYEDSALGLRLETIAANVKADTSRAWSSEVPCDKNGTDFASIAEEAPCILPTTAPLASLDLKEIKTLIKLNGGGGGAVHDETWSRDAGTFYCNEIFFRTLHAIRKHSPGYLVPCMFVHLPPPDVVELPLQVKLVSFITEAIMIGQVGLVPSPQQFQWWQR
ncbi:unnamed protein product [Chrysoparadoxa australica]